MIILTSLVVHLTLVIVVQSANTLLVAVC